MSSRGKEAQELVHWFIMLSKGKRAQKDSSCYFGLKGVLPFWTEGSAAGILLD